MKPKKKSDIFNSLYTNREKIKSFGVNKIGLFGSFVKSTQKLESDIDLLVEFKQEYLCYTNYINLVYFLEDTLETTVDLITSDSLSPYIGPHILKEVEYATL